MSGGAHLRHHILVSRFIHVLKKISIKKKRRKFRKIEWDYITEPADSLKLVKYNYKTKMRIRNKREGIRNKK